MNGVTLSPPNAILFIFDRSNKNVEVPEYIDGQLVASSGSCMSVGTQAAVDGDVVVSLESTTGNVTGLRRVFVGVLHAPGRRLEIVTADSLTVLGEDVATDKPHVEVWTDEQRNPSRIAIIAR